MRQSEGLGNLSNYKMMFPSKDQYIEYLKMQGQEDFARSYEKVCTIAEIVKANGGRTLLVGGVRQPNKIVYLNSQL